MLKKYFLVWLIGSVALISTAYALTDTDSDGMPDDWENLYGLNPSVNDASGDLDNDGMTNIAEYDTGTIPADNDTDDDLIIDGDEYTPGLSDSFETASFNRLNWQFSGNANWQICTDSVYEGEYAACSPPLTDNQSSTLKLTFSVPNISLFSVKYRVSSEDLDTLTIYINSIPFGEFFGDTSWKTFTKVLSSGTHTIELIYEKDRSLSSLEDKAWIDNFVVNSGDSKYGTNPLVPDTDNDGLLDGVEVFQYKCDPLVVDTDNDTLGDGTEVLTYGTDPTLQDTDNDGYYDNEELFNVFTDPLNPDSDNDGLKDGAELIHGTSPLAFDTDNDGMDDGWEIFYGFEPLVNDRDNDGDNDGLVNGDEYTLFTNPVSNDTDADGLKDGEEVHTYFTNPLTADTDGDGMIDGWEVYFNLDPLADSAGGDPDNDGLDNYSEFLLDTAPDTVDSDNDGISDIDETLHVIDIEFPLNQITDEVQVRPSVARIGNQYLVTWQKYELAETDNDTYDVAARLFNAEGDPVTDEFVVNNYTTLSQWLPVAASAGGRYLVVWHSENQDGSEHGVYARLINSDGTPFANEFRCNIYTTSNQSYPAVASNGSVFLVAWSSGGQDGSQYGVFGRFVNPSGVLSEEIQINTYTADWQYIPAIASNGSSFLVTWQSYGQDGFEHGIYGQLFNSSGHKSASEFKISSATGYNQMNPSVCAAGSDYLVTWESVGQDTDGYGIFAQRVSSAGVLLGSEFQVNTLIEDNQEGAVAGFDGTHYLVVWSSVNALSDANINIQGQLFDASGNKVGKEFLLNSAATGYNSSPSLSFNGTNYFIVWESNTYETDDFDIHATFATLYNGYGTSPVTSDTDYDGLKDGDELNIHNTDPLKADSDDDGMPDGWEINNGFNPLAADTTHDNDGDGLTSLEEYWLGTSPFSTDSDNDGLTDGDETMIVASQEKKVNSFTPRDQSMPVIAYGNSSFMVTWTSDKHDGDNDGINGRIIDSNYQPSGAEFQVNTYTTGNQEVSAVASNGSNYLVTWMSAAQDGSETGVYGRYYTDSGSPVTSEFRINSYTEDEQGYPSISSAGNIFLVCWDGYNPFSEYDIYSKQSTLNGSTAQLANTVLSNQYYYSALGSTTAGTSSNNLSKDYMFTTPYYTANASGTVDSIYFYGAIYGKLQIAIYEADTNNVPTLLRGITEEYNTGSLGWHQFFLQQTVVLENNKNYFIALLSDSSTTTFRYKSGNGFIGQRLYSAGFPEISPTVSAWPAEISAFAMYAVAERPDNSHMDGWFLLDTSISKAACSFSALDTGPLAKVRLRLKKTGTPAGGSVWVSIYTNSSNKPGSLIGAVSSTVDVSQISSDQYGSNADFYFGSSVSLTAGQTYWIVLEGNYARSAGTGISWGYDNDYTTSPVGANASTHNGTAWSAQNKSLLYASWVRQIGAEELFVNHYTSGWQYSPVVESNGSSYLMTWHSYGQDGAEDGIYAYIIDSNGLKTGAEFKVNSSTSASQRDMQAASDGSNYFIVWEDNAGDGDSRAIKGRLFTETGTPLTDEFRVNSFTQGDQFDPAVACSGTYYLVVWASTFNLDTGSNIHGQFYDLTGQKFGSEFIVNSLKSGTHVLPDITSDGSEFVVAWQGKNLISNAYDIFYTHIRLRPNAYGTNPANEDSDGDELSDADEIQVYFTNPLRVDSDSDGIDDHWELNYGLDPLTYSANDDLDNDGYNNYEEYLFLTNPINNDSDNDGLTDQQEAKEVRINVYTTSSQLYPSVASDGSNYFITWTSTAQDTNSEGVYARLMDNDGDTIRTEFQINTYTTGVQVFSEAASSGSSYMAVWQSTGQDGDEDGVFGQMFDLSGNPINTEFAVNTYTNGSQNYPALASNGTNYFVVWASSPQDGSNAGVAGRFFALDGTPAGNDFIINTYTISAQYTPSVATDGSTYLVAWTSAEQDGSSFGVYGRLYSSAGTPLTAEMRINATTSEVQYVPLVSSNGDNYLVVWQQWDTLQTKGSIQARLLNSDGSFGSGEMQINSYTISSSSNCAVSSDGNGYLVAWQIYTSNGDQDVIARFLDNDGTPASSEFRLHFIRLLNQRYPSLASNGSTYYAAWNSRYQDNSGYSVHGMYIYQYENELRTDPLIADTDNDGLIDSAEPAYGTRPNNPDTDNDGMPDGWEASMGLDPLSNDSAGDKDNDGVSNKNEYLHGIHANNTDSDNDGLNDGLEIQQGYNPASSDSDNDTLPDGWEVNYNMNPLSDNRYDDNDNDGLSNEKEFLNNTNPLYQDTDGDSQDDMFEVIAGTEPDDETDYFTQEVTTDAAGSAIVRFPCAEGRVYRIFYTDNLSTASRQFGADISTGSPGMYDFIDNGYDFENNGSFEESNDIIPSNDNRVTSRFYIIHISDPAF
ncbi:MAG: choice-of-anchor R domain-containing protein [Candidatus Auribacterota bacterium]